MRPDGQRSKHPNPELIKQYQMQEGQLSKEAFLAVLDHASGVMRREANLLRVDGQVVIFGDIHGQFYDLIEVLRKQRWGSTSKKFVFLGDYVDRGMHGPECVAYLFALKARHPNQIFLLRGNHETQEQAE